MYKFNLFRIGLFCWLFCISASFAHAADSATSTIKFATEATYPPFVTLSPDGKIGGFETELVKAICEEANLKCEFLHRPFDSLFPNLTLKKIDAVYGCVGITKERKGQVLFSNTLYTSPTGFIYKQDSFKEGTLNNEAFQDKVIAIQQGTTGFEKYLSKHYPNAKLKTYASIQDALLDLNNQRVQAVFGDIPVFKYWTKQNNKSNFSFFAIPKAHVLEFSEGVAIAVRKEETALMHKINMALEKLSNNGSLKKLEQQYLDE